MKKTVLVLALGITLLSSNTSLAQSYTVQPGDTFYLISKSKGVDMYDIMDYNSATDKTVIYPGQILNLSKDVVHNNKGVTHKITNGDTLWKISIKYLVTIPEILKVNPGMTESTELNLGDTVNIPPRYKLTAQSTGKYGAYLDWQEVNKGMPIGSVFKVTDLYTGKSYDMKRTIGAGHADVETLTKADTDIMMSIWGKHSWLTRPSIVEFEGVSIAASVSFMPHAGNEKAPGGLHTNWRNGGYGPGPNYDYIKGNGMEGHVDIHFKNSVRHKDGKIDWDHQAKIKIAAGIK